MYKKAYGFTIIELLIVIIIIAILATVTIVAFTGIQKRAMASTLQDTLTKVARAMDVAAVDTGTYAYFPSTITASSLPKDVGIALTEPQAPGITATTYCINATTTRYNDLTYYIQKGGSPEEGLCEGIALTGVGQRLGSYNDEAAGDDDVSSSDTTAAVEVNGDGGGLRVAMNEAWSAVTISWDAVSGAQRYRVQVDRGDGVWVYVNKTNGGSTSGIYNCANYETIGGCSARIEATTTSVEWTDAHSRIVDATKTYRYRVHAVTADGETPWYTASLTASTTNRTTVKHFKVAPITPDDITQYVLSWDSVTPNNVPSPAIQIQFKRGDGDWLYAGRTAGGSSESGYSCGIYGGSTAYCSGRIDASLTSITWSNSYARPQNVDEIMQYRIRLYSTRVAGVYSDWTTITYEHVPEAQRSSPSNFSVTAGSGWSSVVLQWQNAASINIPNPYVEIQVKRGGAASWTHVGKTAGASSESGYGCSTSDTTTACSGMIPAATSALTWTSSYSIPPVGQTYEYKIQYRSNTITNLKSTPIVVQLSR